MEGDNLDLPTLSSCERAESWQERGQTSGYITDSGKQDPTLQVTGRMATDSYGQSRLYSVTDTLLYWCTAP